MLSEAGILGYRLVDSSIDAKSKLLPDQEELLDNSRRYKRLMGKLNYLTMTQPDVAFSAQF